jgi:phosphate transport system permease protein
MTSLGLEPTRPPERGRALLPSPGLRRRLRMEQGVRLVLGAVALLSVAVTVAIALSLMRPALEFFREVAVAEFLSGTTWAPLFAPAQFGVCGRLSPERSW